MEVARLERLASVFVYHVAAPSEVDPFLQAARVVPQVVAAQQRYRDSGGSDGG